jgi:hypothetical protein
LQVAHQVGLIHRDLKPDNIFLTRDNRLKVLDFGIAKMLNEIGFTTRKDIVLGSILYMSPEQVQGLPLSARSDICALGLVMFEALIGKHSSLLVFERDLSERREPSRPATLADIPPIQVSRMPPTLSELDPNIPRHVAQLVQRAISKIESDRFPTMCDFVSAMRDCLATFVKGTPIELRGARDRDLSLEVPRASEVTPASQRATPRRGLVWDGAGSPTPAATVTVPPPAKLYDVTMAMRPLPADGDSNLHTPSPVVSVTAARASATASFRNAIIAGSLFGAALGTIGALTYFGSASRVAGASSSQNSMVASLSPAMPIATSERAPALEPPPEHEPSAVAPAARVVSSPALHQPTMRSTAPLAHATPTLTRAIVSAKSVNDDPRSKLINGGKLIYGD